jgi:hypothetical protein
MSIVTTVFGLTGLYLWANSGRACNFVKFTDLSGSGSVREFGIWFEESSDKTCQRYPSNTAIDGQWEAARAFIILVPLILFITVILRLFALCGKRVPTVSVPIQYLSLAICQGLTFLFLGSTICKANPLLQEMGGIDYPDTCAISTGAKYSISATVFFLLGALSSFIELIMARELEEAGLQILTCTQVFYNMIIHRHRNH